MKSQRASWTQVLVFCMIIFLFWLLRIWYWTTTKEIPFSDMANFDSTAHTIVSSWNFDWSPFWQTYTTPSLVTARALQIFLFGDSMWAWQLFQAFFTFAGLLWLSYELMRVTNSRWLALSLLFIVSISKPSIFWSLKLSREGFHEFLIYAQIASFLLAYRVRTLTAFFVLGAISAVSFLNRANGILVIPVLVLMIVLFYVQKRNFIISYRFFFLPLLCFFLGIALLWVPWIARSIMLYGKPVPLSTQGPYGFLWELGTVSVKLGNGTKIKTDVNDLQKNAPNDFPTDLAASRYANEIVKAWLHKNWRDFPQMALKRIQGTISDRQIDLTKVDRNQLFNNRVVNNLMVDKTTFFVYTGIVGMLLFPILYRQWALLSIPTVILVTWLSGAVLVSDGRMLEPGLPVILFSNVAWVILLYFCCSGLVKRFSLKAPL